MLKKISILLLIGVMAASVFSQRYGESDDFSYALKLFNEGFYDIAAQQFNLFVNRYPDSERLPDAKYYLALSLYNVEDYENARIEFQSLAVSYPDHNRAPEAWQKVGACYLKLDKPEEAARALETVKVLYPQDPNAPPALYQAAEIYYQQKKYQKAEMSIQDFLDRYPASAVYPEGRLLYARILMQQQNFDQAYKEFEKVLKSDANPEVLAAANNGLGEFYETLGQLQKAREKYQVVLDQYLGTAGAFTAVLRYSDLLAKTRDYPAAVSLINQNISRFKTLSQDAALNLRLAAVRYLQGNYVAARKTLESLQPDVLSDSLAVRVYFYLGNVYLQEEKFDRSVQSFNKILQDDELREAGSEFIPETRKQTGLALLRSGQYLQGNQQIINYMEDYPGDPDNQKLLVQLIEDALATDNPDAAGTLYHRLLRDYPQHPRRDDMLYKIGKYYLTKKNYSLAQQEFTEFIKQYYASALYDSAAHDLAVIRNYYQVDEGVGVNKLARLMGQMLAGQDKSALKLELARIYLNQLKDPQEAIRISDGIVNSASDSSVLGQAWFIRGESYRRLAELKKFEHAPNGSALSDAEESLKNAMGYIEAVPEKDSLSFSFLQLTTQGGAVPEIPAAKRIKYWEHYINNYSGSPLIHKARMILAGSYLAAGDTMNALLQLESVRKNGAPELAGEAYFRSGRILYRQGNFSRASEYLKEFLLNIPVHPQRAEAFALLAGMREKTGQYSEAAQFWMRLREQYNYAGVAEEALTNIPQTYLLAGEYQAVLDFTGPYVRQNYSADLLLQSLQQVDEPEFYYYAGKAYFNLENYPEARNNLLSYLYSSRTRGFFDESQFVLAEIAEREGDKDAAIIHLQAIARNEQSPLFIQATAKIADIYFDRENYPKAEELYAKLAQRNLDPDQLIKYQARQMIAWINQGKLSRYESGLSGFKKEFKDHEARDEYLAKFEFEVGKYYYRNKKFDAAIKKFENVTGHYKKTAFADDAEYYLGLTYTTLNKVEKAQDILSGFAEKYPNSSLQPNIYVTLGGLFYRAEKRDLAVGAFKRAVELAEDPDTKKIAISNLIKLYQDLGIWDGVLTQCRAYAEAFPDAPDVMDKKILIGSALSNLNRYSEAVDYLKKLKYEANSEQEPEIQFYIGEAYFNAGQYENANRELVKIPLLSKQTKLQWEASALYFSGQAYEKLGRIPDAIRMYQEIVNRPGIMVDLKREAQKRIEQLKNPG